MRNNNKNYDEILESYLIPAMESDINNGSISSIIKKYPIKYPNELNNYQFDMKGNFDKGTKSSIENFFYHGWSKRINSILSEVFELPQYNQKIKKYCEKTNFKISDFKIQLVDIYFRVYKKDVKNNNMFINITFDDIDRYNAPGFSNLMLPILSQVIKSDIGSNWIVEAGEYPTDFNIHRNLTSSEIKPLVNIQECIDKKNNEAKQKAAKAAAAKKLRDQKMQELINNELKNSEKFYSQSVEKQAMEIIKFFTFDTKMYYDNYDTSELLPRCNNELKSIKPENGEKIITLKYDEPNSFNIFGKSIRMPRIAIAITDDSSNYKKLKKVYFVYHNKTISRTLESYIKEKILSK